MCPGVLLLRLSDGDKRDTADIFYKRSNRNFLSLAVNQVIDATIYIKVRKNAKRFMATLICHKTRISSISSVGHAKGGLAMQYSWNISLHQHKTRWNKVPVQNIASPSVQKPSSKVPREQQFIIGSKEKFWISWNISNWFVGKFCSLCYKIYIKL